MITLTFKNNSVEIEKSSDVKYIAKLSNFDRKFVFARDFVNGKSLVTYDNSFILEAVSKDKKTKVYYIIDSKTKEVKEATYEEVKKMASDDRDGFGFKYFR